MSLGQLILTCVALLLAAILIPVSPGTRAVLYLLFIVLIVMTAVGSGLGELTNMFH